MQSRLLPEVAQAAAPRVQPAAPRNPARSPTHSIQARKDGKVIRIRLAGPMTTPGGSVLVTPRADETWPELDPDTQTAATGQFTGFAQAIDLGWRSAWSELLATASIAPEQKLPAGFNFAPLPARQFCAGHTFWVQQGGVEGNSDCFSVRYRLPAPRLQPNPLRLQPMRYRLQPHVPRCTQPSPRVATKARSGASVMPRTGK